MWLVDTPVKIIYMVNMVMPVDNVPSSIYIFHICGINVCKKNVQAYKQTIGKHN